MSTAFTHRYGPWALVLGASDGVGAAFARACLALGVRGAELRAISNPAGVREKAHWRTKEALSALARAVRRLLAEEGGARRPPG